MPRSGLPDRVAPRDTRRTLGVYAQRTRALYARGTHANEGYPNVDPAFARKANDDAWLPFAAGYQRMIAWAERDGVTRVSVIPVGFHYTRSKKWSIVARIGAPCTDLAHVEDAVRALSQPV